MNLYDFKVKTIDGSSVSLADYKGKVLLIVNVASECGLTPHYEGLQDLYQQYKDQGLVVLGFPCNQFGAQEPGTDQDIKQFCTTRFGVSFPMFSKIDVNGPDADPLYDYLKQQQPGENSDSANIEWNFAKFLVDREGRVVHRFHPKTEPSQLVASIEALL